MGFILTSSTAEAKVFSDEKDEGRKMKEDETYLSDHSLILAFELECASS